MSSHVLFSFENDIYNVTGSVSVHTPILDTWMAKHRSFVTGLTE